MANPGQPLLPVYGLRVLLPQGEDVASVSVKAEGEDSIVLSLPVALARAELPTDSVPQEPAVMPDPDFDQSSEYPADRAVHVSTGTFRGYTIAFVNLYPVTYRAQDRTLSCARRLHVTIETAPSAAMLARSLSTLRGGAARDISALKRLVGDTELEVTYAASARLMVAAGLTDPDETYPYVIITNAALEARFEPLRQHRELRGLRAKIVLVSDIAANYSGADLQTKIRAFIIDAYLNWETEFVLLAGDDNIIPHRGLYAVGPSAIDTDIASDLYYGALDGNWNSDGDGYWGEPAEADLLPEVSVGRAAVGDSAEAANFVAKVIKYETSPVVGQIKTGQMLGEALSAGTWGGDYKDEVRLGSSTHGYTTEGFPAGFTVGTLYDRDLPQAWTKNDVIPLLNSGRHLVNHLGHSNVTYGIRMLNADVETSFTNDGTANTYFLLYSQGCYAGSFDNRMPVGYTDDCIGEHFTFIKNGAVAFIGNTRYGWYMPYSTNGTSQHYDRQFFDALLGEDVTALGSINDDSRVDNAHLINVSAMRWVYYDLVLLGDPAMDVWTDSPESLLVVHPEMIWLADNQVEITVSDGGGPLEGARVSIFSDSTYASGLTDAGGGIYLDPLALNAGELLLAVAAHNHYAYLDTILVEPADGPVLNVDDVTIDDDGLGVSSGDGDAVAEAGETIESVISLKNVGPDSAFTVSAVLTSADAFIVLMDSTGSYGDIPPDSVAVPAWSFSYEVSPSTPDGYVAAFTLGIECSDTTFVRQVWVPVSAPQLEVAGIFLGDSLYGNGDGCVEPGEGVEVTLGVANRGSGDAYGVSLVVTENDPYVEIEVDSAYADTIRSDQEVSTAPAFLVRLSPDCPELHRIDLTLTVTLASGRVTGDSLAIYVGGSLAEDMESGAPGWTHSDFNDTRIDQWHLDTYRNHTAGGSYAWKFGGSGSVSYSNFGHGALETPEICLGPGATLVFWHWIHAELNYNSYAWDGGIVEISADGGETWSQLTPVGGYPYKIYPNMFSPFPGETRCFAWTADWTRVEFDLSAYSGRAKIRFRFGSDQYYAEEGWYIDDVTISDDYASVPIPDEDLRPGPVAFALAAISPNPVRSKFDVKFDVPRRSAVAIHVFDVAGRVVATLADSVFEPGRYSSTFETGSALAPGVYFLGMRAGEFAATRKVIVLK